MNKNKDISHYLIASQYWKSLSLEYEEKDKEMKTKSLIDEGINLLQRWNIYLQ